MQKAKSEHLIAKSAKLAKRSKVQKGTPMKQD